MAVVTTFVSANTLAGLKVVLDAALAAESLASVSIAIAIGRGEYVASISK